MAGLLAARKQLSEDVRILAVIEAERELRKVERQVGFAHVMERPDNATLEQAPKAFDVVRVHVARTYSCIV